LANSRLFTTTQVFNLAILPGTAFRQEAAELGLKYQTRPPYYVYETPTLQTADLYTLMEDAQEVFDSEWDPFPDPQLEFADSARPINCLRWDLDLNPSLEDMPKPAQLAQALAVWFTATDFAPHMAAIEHVCSHLLAANPHSTLQIVLEPKANYQQLKPQWIERLLRVCYQNPSYLDRYYSLNPQGLLGSKRVVIKVPQEVNEAWAEDMLETAALVE
jgi:hypothetical protein